MAAVAIAIVNAAGTTDSVCPNYSEGGIRIDRSRTRCSWVDSSWFCFWCCSIQGVAAGWISVSLLYWFSIWNNSARGTLSYSADQIPKISKIISAIFGMKLFEARTSVDHMEHCPAWQPTPYHSSTACAAVRKVDTFDLQSSATQLSILLSSTMSMVMRLLLLPNHWLIFFSIAGKLLLIFSNSHY